MKSNLKIEKIDYRVNEEKRTVACILTCDMQLRKHPAFDMHFYYQWRKRMPKVDYNGEFTYQPLQSVMKMIPLTLK